MLSRFSKLPGVLSSVFHSTKHPQAAIDKASAEIKRLGRSSNGNDDTLLAITKILSLMKKYDDSLHVQRVSCHALSNLAMQVVVARWIVQKGGFNLIKRALLRFEDDHRICWLGSSAVWNLARPPVNRSVIGHEGVKLMLRMLRNHRDREKVINTSIGALSNLSLCDSLKDEIAQQSNIKLILSVLSENAENQSLSVMTSGAGLIANLAVSDEHANTLVQKDSLRLLLGLLRWKGRNVDVDDTLYRNTCAALNNMVTASAFLDSFLENRGVEIIFDFFKSNNNALYANLLENCLVNIEVDVGECTTSFHLCAQHGRLSILQQLIESDPFIDMDAADSKNMTALDYAINGKYIEIVEFLSKCGAAKFQANILSDNKDEKERERIENAMRNGHSVLRKACRANAMALAKALPSFPTHICNLMVTFHSNVSLLQSIKKYN